MAAIGMSYREIAFFSRFAKLLRILGDLPDAEDLEQQETLRQNALVSFILCAVGAPSILISSFVFVLFFSNNSVPKAWVFMTVALQMTCRCFWYGNIVVMITCTVKILLFMDVAGLLCARMQDFFRFGFSLVCSYRFVLLLPGSSVSEHSEVFRRKHPPAPHSAAVAMHRQPTARRYYLDVLAQLQAGNLFFRSLAVIWALLMFAAACSFIVCRCCIH